MSSTAFRVIGRRRATRARLLRGVLLLAGCAMALPLAAETAAPAVAASAQAEPAAPAAAPPGAAPTALDKYKEEPVPGGALLLAAYMVMWALAAALVGRVVMRQARTEAELKDLAERVDVATEAQA